MRRGRPSTIAPVISPTGGSTFAERDLLRSAAAGHDSDNQRRQQQQLVQEQQPNASSPDALVHVRPEPSRYGQQWQRGKPLESGQQQESKPGGRQQGIVPTAQQFEHVDGSKENYFGAAKSNATPSTTSALATGLAKTSTSFKVDDDPVQLRVRPGAGGRPTSASPAANASADSGGRAALEAWDLRGPVTGAAGGSGGDRKRAGGGVELGAFDGFADTFDFGGRDAGSSGLAAPMQAIRSSATTAAAAGGLSTSAPGSVSTLFHMYNPPTTTTRTAAAASSATSASNNSTNLIPPTSTRVPTRTGPGAFHSGKRDAFEGLAGVNFGSGAAAPTIGAIQSLNTPPISTTAGNNVGANRSSPMLVPPSPGRGSRTPGSVSSELSAEERFPSIEDYERGSPAPGLSASLQPPAGLSTTTTDWRKALTPSPSGPGTNSAFHRPALTPQPSTSSVKPGSVVGYGGAGGSHILPSGARSQHTTGTAMKDAEQSRIRAGSGFTSFQMADPHLGAGLHRRQSLNISSKSGPMKPIEPALPPRPAAKKPDLVGGLGPRKPSAPPKDWLTGQDTGGVTSPPPPPQPASTTSPPAPTPGLTRKLSASFIRRASQYGELQQMSTGQSRKAGPPVPDKSSVPLPSANRPMSDSSGDEGPEDALGSVGKQQGSRFRPSHTGRKQGSVYDLVDVGGSSTRPPASPKKKSLDQFGRRQQSVHDLVDVTSSEAAAPSPLTARPRAESPQPLQPAKTPQSAQFRFPPIGQSSPPSSIAEGAGGGRRRPQSMFLSPSPSSLQVPRSPAEPQVPESPTKTPGAQPESPRKIRHPRRNSIVDLVSKYEAMDAAAGARAAVAAANPKSPGGPPPPIASKPATLQGHVRTTSVTKRSSLDIPPPAPTQHPRTSPTVETQRRRMSVSPSRRMPSPASFEFSQQPVRAPSPSRPPLSPVLTAGSARPITPPTLSPSPERPYQGVASLISQWQKKSESAANTSRSSPKAWK